MTTETRRIAVEHVTARTDAPFEAVVAALRAAVPPLDVSWTAQLQADDVDAARTTFEQLAPLSLIGERDFGAMLRTAGQSRRAIQFEVGNPATATRMTRHDLSAALYAPIRLLVREDSSGTAIEYDRPTSTFGSLGNSEVDAVAGALDARIAALVAALAAGAR